MREPLPNIIAPLTEWFEENKRILPWRADREPYHVWISEIMLQQTRIEAVMRYYERFTDALPDIKSLSVVDDDTLLKLWEGLGYYSRARNLKKAAQKIVSDFGGSFPETYREILTLPGIGEYTAGAIASICFDAPVAAVDGNVLLPETKKAVTERLNAVMPKCSGAFNEALMELGETVCLPNGAPLCESCPLSGQCRAYRDGLTAEIPVRVKKLKRSRADKTVLILRDKEGRLAVEKRPDTGLLAGMYQLPNLDGNYSEKELYDILAAQNIRVKNIARGKSAKHVFTHIDWYMQAYAVAVEAPCDRYLWVSDSELKERFPLPTAFRKLLN